MDFRPRRYVWIIDLVGMLAGAGLAGHLVANQIVSALSPEETRTEKLPQPKVSRRARPIVSAWSDPTEHVDARSYEISRALVDEIVSSIGSRPHGILIVPAMAHDRPVGVHVFGGGYGLLDAIGLRSGDLVLKANGLPLTHPDVILAAYAASQRTGKASLLILRDGRRIPLRYAIVDSLRAQSRRSARQAAVNSSWVP